MKDILTEAEAKTRWCPKMFGTNMEGGDGLTDQVVERLGKCIASECMAWRLAHKDAADGAERGYCGAFGLPRFT